MQYTVAIDPNRVTRALSSRFGARGIPFAVLFDENGVVKYVSLSLMNLIVVVPKHLCFPQGSLDTQWTLVLSKLLLMPRRLLSLPKYPHFPIASFPSTSTKINKYTELQGMNK